MELKKSWYILDRKERLHNYRFLKIFHFSYFFGEFIETETEISKLNRPIFMFHFITIQLQLFLARVQ